jgi:hypothetical protein
MEKADAIKQTRSWLSPVTNDSEAKAKPCQATFQTEATLINKAATIMLVLL